MGVCVKAVARFAAMALFTSAAWTQPPDAEEILRHAIELHQSGNVAAAIPEYRAYLKQVPDNFMARSNLGAALAHTGLYEEAIVEYKKALELQSGNLPVRLNLALAYYKAAEISQAAAELERVVAAKPDERQAIFLLADCDLRLGENKKVIELLTPLEPQSADDKALDYMLGTALIRDNQASRGQLLVDRILRNGDSAEARLMMGETKMSVRDFKGALEDFEKAVALNPRLPDVYSYYGMALAATGDTPAAAVAFRKELEANSNDYTSNVQLGILLKQDQDFAGARRCFERALNVRPHDAAARYQVATLDLETGETEEARIELESLAKEIPQFVEAHVSLATVYYRLKRKEDGDKQRAIVLRLNAEKQAQEPGSQAAGSKAK
jgi:tetratricopeptide (TPR) repeat protein